MPSMVHERPQLVIADQNGEISSVPFLEGCGMKAGEFFRLSSRHLKKLPPCSQLMMLPGRVPVAFDPNERAMVSLDEHPLSPGSVCYPVAAFLTPGYTGTFSSAFLDQPRQDPLPLFAYTAVVFYHGEFYSASVQVDREQRQDPRLMDLERMQDQIVRIKKMFPGNRLVRHLEDCACINGCPAAKNFFLERYEAPLPTSPTCNCRCRGCISYQPEGKIPVTQPRIRFVPSPDEIAEVALYHMDHVTDPVVSFGQGCEGEPLMAAPVLEKAIRLIRARTAKGIINLNSNASRPGAVARLFDAGLDSLRVSLNSVRESLYRAYYRPRDYTFADVCSSVKQAGLRRGFVSLNYLVMPGVTDSVQEYQALRAFLKSYPVSMIQWRNLNFDPRAYIRMIKFNECFEAIGIDRMICLIHREHSHVMKGYFNPSRLRMRRCARDFSSEQNRIRSERNSS